MIKTNLVIQGEGFDPTNVGGMDLSKINVKLVLIAIVIFYLPDFTLLPSLESSKEEANQKVVQLNNKRNQLRRKVKEVKEFEKQITELENQEKKLKKRLEVIKNVSNSKVNPWKVILYISKNIPENVWLTGLSYNQKEMELVGYALSYKDIGDFIENLKKSVFFDKEIQYAKEGKDSAKNDELKKFAPFVLKVSVLKFE